MSEEAILSEELLAELGNDPNAVVVGKKRKQALTEEEKKIKYMPQEELKKFKKLSKKEQKKVLQREKKKERASKQGEYMDIIKANEISQEQRDMLQSSRQLNHTATLREQLTLLLKKERAGIKLSDEELDLLYPNRHQGADSDEADDEDDLPPVADPVVKSSVKPSAVVSQPSPASNIVPSDSNNTAEGDTLFSFTSLFKPATAPPRSNSDSEDDRPAAKKTPKKKKKKATNDAPAIPEAEEAVSSTPSAPPAAPAVPAPTEEAATKPPVTKDEKKPFSAAGLGKNLLAQFSKIKEQKAATDSTNDDKDRKISTIFSTEFDYNPDKPHAFVSNVPHHDEAALVAPTTEAPKAAATKKPLVEDIYYNYRRHMTIERPHQVAVDRMNLPVCQMEQEIVEAVHNHDVIILCGETGSGKSTQVPQFLYEAGYAQDENHLIGIAQPRRVAVTSTAERVNFEMGSTLPALARQKKLNKHKKNQRKLRQKQRARRANGGGEEGTDADAGNGDDDIEEAADDGSDDEALLAQHYPNGRKVGYQIRYDSTTVGSDTRIKFMTDGILLREISQDLLLRQYSVIILDEAHERNVNTDILLGMISRAIPLRKEIAAKEYAKWKTLTAEEQADFATPLTPLKLIIMSATLRVDDFRQERLFHPLPPIIKVDARQYPVSNHFAKRTEIRDYLQEAFKKTCQIHERLPAGGVLVFLTGKREILYMCQRLQRALGRKHGRRGAGQGRRPAAASTSTGTDADADADAADDAPLVALLNNLKQQAAAPSDGDVGFDGDQVDEIDAGSDVDDADDFAADGDDDYDAMNWDDRRQLADADDGNRSDDESVLSDIDDEDYVKAPAVAAKKTKTSRDGSDSDSDDEAAAAAKLRREMLAKVLGKGAAAADAETDAAKSSDEDDRDSDAKKTAAGDETTGGTAAAAADDEAAEPAASAVDDAPKLKPWILPLYAMMPAHLQKKVFAPVPKGHRLIVVATNVAETSITIPGIRYVVDSGRCKEKVLASASTGTSDEGGAQASVYEAGITRYEVRWISKASADQRAGRAGRTGPGHCYRLFSSNFYHEHMQAFMPPEINVTPLEDIVLHMLSLGITEIESFPFPSNPPRAAVHAAVALLKNLGAIEPETAAMRAKERDARLWALLNQQAQQGGRATTPAVADEAIVLGQLSPLGKMLRWFPIHPRFAKMLVIATQTTQTMRDVPARYRLLSHVLTMVATLTERSVFVFDDVEANDADDDDGDDSDADDDDDDSGADDEDDDDGSDGAHRRKRKAAASAKQRAAKKAKPSTKEACHAEGRKLFHHASGDVMARLRATGAYLFTLYAALRRLRRERLVAEAAARREQQRQQAMNVDDDAAGAPAAANDGASDDDALSIDAEAERKPFQKWEYDAANQDAAVVALCQKFHLHQGTLQRIVDLRNQLQHILQGLYHRLTAAHRDSHSSSDAIDGDVGRVASFDIVLEPPTTAEETALRQILLSGYCDQIAKRAPFASIEPHLQRLQQQQQQQLHQTASGEKPINFLSRRRKFTAYLSGHPSLQTTGPVYVHPTSNCYAHDITLASETLPEYIVYTHMMKNQRGDCLYLTNVTVVSPQWITDVALTCPLVSIRHSDVMHQLDLASAVGGGGHSSGAKKASSSLGGGKKRRSALSDDEDVDDDSGSEDDALVAASSSMRGKSIAPFYDEARECMMLYVKPRYGVHLWTLPTTVLPMRYVLEHWHTGDASSSGAMVATGGSATTSSASSSAMPVGYRMEDLEFRWFARCLLFGQVAFPVPVPQLQRACLQDVHCVQQSKPHPKLLPVLRRLVEARVASRGALTQQLALQSNFLAKELEALLKPDQQRGFRVAWMRLAQYAAAAAKQSPSQQS